MEQREKTVRHAGAFTFVELLVSISILATISIIGYVSYSGHLKSSYNTIRIQTIDSLHLSLSDYYQMKKVLPEPNSNFISYDIYGTYAHSLSGAYGVSGHVSNNFLPSGYVNFGATDPESNQYYGYGKLTSGSSSFDVASVLYDEVTGGYKTYIRGTYDKQRLASLIRSYSSSNFVSQDSTENLPYNPYERKITGYVSSYSGSITLTGSIGVQTFTGAQVFTGELNSGDTVIVDTGSTALVHLSDGSELSLGSTASQTVLNLKSLAYGDEANLASKVSLYLSLGEVWTEAPHLRTESDSPSDFSIQTDSAVAAVRGTVFGLTRSSTGATSISLEVGKLDVKKVVVNPVSPNTTMEQSFTGSVGFTTSSTATGWFLIDGSGSHMVVPDGGTPIRLGNIVKSPYTSGGTQPTSTGSINKAEIDKKIQHPPFSLGSRPKADKIVFAVDATSLPTWAEVPPYTNSLDRSRIQTGTLSVTFQNPGADSYVLYFGTGELDIGKPFPLQIPGSFYTGALDSTSTGSVTITRAFAQVPNGVKTQRTYALRVCLHGVCSAPDIKVLGGETFSFDAFPILGEKKTALPPVCSKNPTKQEFWKSECLVGANSGLVAYAPYDMVGDLELYKSWSTISKNTDNIKIDHCDPTYSQCQASIYTGRLANVPSDPDMMNGFATYSDGIKWIFIDNESIGWSGQDYLKYTIPTGLLGNNFRIEMSVRGGALQRTSWDFYLFNTRLSASNEIYLELNDGILNLWIWAGSRSPKVIIPHTDIDWASLDNNAFYTVVATFNGTNWTLQIKEKNLSATWTAINNTWTNYFIGSIRDNSTNQWNDIIDYVKIYKN